MAEESHNILAGSYIKCILDSGLIDGVPNDRIEEVIASFHPRPCEFTDGDVVCREGEKALCLWIVVKGRVDVQHNSNNLVDRAPPYVLGEQAIIDPGENRSATLRACLTETFFCLLVMAGGADDVDRRTTGKVQR